MQLQIKKAKLVKNQFGKNDIMISMIGLYDENGKRVKRVKLDDVALQGIISEKIPFNLLIEND